MHTIKHPKGLYILFMTEFWERFGFYTVQALLVLFLSKVFLFTDDQSYSLFGAYAGLIYASPVIGGYLADNFLGFRRAIYFGGILFILGYLGLTLFDGQNAFYLSLAFLICGNGFFKSNVSSLLGTLYDHPDIRRDSGFTLFYMGINFGSFVATLFCTYVAAEFGWHYGFGLAAIGMLLGMITFTWGSRYLEGNGSPPHPSQLHEPILFGISREHLIYALTLGCVFLISLMIHYPNVVNIGLLVFGALILAYIVKRAYQYQVQQRNHLIVIVVLLIFVVIFWALYFQTFMSVTLFIERSIDRQIFGWVMPTAMFQSFNPLFIILLCPIMAKVWIKMAYSRYNPSTPMKFAIGLLLVSFGFFAPAIGSHFINNAGLIPMGWIVLCFFLQTVGELFLSPVGLSMITQLAPREMIGFLMGVWFLATGAANAVGGKIASFTTIPENIHDTVTIDHLYGHHFMIFALVGTGVSLLLMILTPWLKRMMK
ncbi:MAG: MFS transporter [Legionellales bacterium]|nr:MFS transporter [Legionellales bacterium]|tara:strand:+ start:8391 stop:9839 length:1449 start_codon:yes stop_codon:yes gene_type:complete